MAQTKRKRRSKHRGTAAGTIEARGRTGRPLTAEEKKKDDRAKQREKRLYTAPTWQASAKRAAIASVLMLLFLMLTARGSIAQRLILAILFAAGAFGLYTAAGYYLDLYLYRRRMRKRDAGS